MKAKNALLCARCGNIFSKDKLSCPHCESRAWFHLDSFLPDPEDLGVLEPDHGNRPERDLKADPPRPFFVRCWQLITKPFRLEIDLPR
jgi:hypothetical protein